MKKNILISGGCGFVGKNIINFIHKKFKLIVIDNFSSGNKNFIPKQIDVNKVDIQNKSQIQKIFKKKKFTQLFIVQLTLLTKIQ